MNLISRQRGPLGLFVIATLVFLLTVNAKAQQDLSPNYTWKPVKIGAGGWMRGMAVSASDPTRRLARADVDNVYSWNDSAQTWVPLKVAGILPSNITAAPSSAGGAALAIDPNNPNHVMIAWDFGRSSDLCNSNSCPYPVPGLTIYYSTNLNATVSGTTFTQSSTTFAENPYGDPNADLTTGTYGERLAIDPNNSSVAYFGSPQNGLQRTTNGGASWSQVTGSGFPTNTSTPTSDGTFYEIILPRIDGGNNTIAVGGVTVSKTLYAIYQTKTRTTNNGSVSYAISGSGVLVSNNGGQTWTDISPNHDVFENATIDTKGGYLWIGGQSDGKLYKFPRNGSASSWTTITNATYGGYGGITVDPTNSSRVFAANGGGGVARSTNGGSTWTDISNGNTGKPYYATSQTIQWLEPSSYRPQSHTVSVSGIYLDSTGTHLYMNCANDDILVTTPNDASDSTSNPPVWTAQAEGVEELVGQTVIDPPGASPVVSVEDETLFTINTSERDSFVQQHFGDQSSPALSLWVSPFSDTYDWPYENNGLATAQDINYAPNQPQFMAITTANITAANIYEPIQNYSSYSSNGGQTWNLFPSITSGYIYLPGQAPSVAPQNGNHPNVLYDGEIAISARPSGHVNDAPGSDNIVWFPTAVGGAFAYVPAPFYSTDGGAHWTQSATFNNIANGIIYNPQNSTQSGVAPAFPNYQYLPFQWGPWTQALKTHAVLADPITPYKFYAWLDLGGFWTSVDKGATWQQQTGANLPPYAANAQMVANPSASGDLWFADGYQGASTHGLWHSTNGGVSFNNAGLFDYAWDVTMGAAAPGSSYYTIYVYGKLHNYTGTEPWGVYQSTDNGNTFNQISHYPTGLIDTPSSLAASYDTFGTVYVSFGGNSLVYGTCTSGCGGGGTTAPGSPSLSASPGNGLVNLSWTPGSGGAPTSYNVYRGASSGAESLLTANYTSTTYTDYSLTNGTTYYYYINATNSAGTSGHSNEASATPSGGGCTSNCGSGQTLFGNSTPSGALTTDTAQYELGVQFKSDVAGQITGLRVYRPTSNGLTTYAATLWSASGTALEAINIPAPTAGAWATASFPAPVAITAGTTYVVSYSKPSGYYYWFAGGGLASPVVSGDLSTLAGSGINNGVYSTTPGHFPTSSYNSSNYFADIVFTAGSGSSSGQAQVSLTPSVDVAAIYADGSTFSSTGGLDRTGSAYSATQLGSSLTYSGVTYNFGGAGEYDAVGGSGAPTVALPAGNYSALNFLGTGFNGNQPSQVFTVTYTDGSTTQFTQSMSDWYTPQGYSGEATALTTSYRNTSSGGENTGPFNLYRYSFALNIAKTVQSLTLPNNANIAVLAITLSGSSGGASITLNSGTHYEIENQAGAEALNDYQYGQTSGYQLHLYTPQGSSNEEFTAVKNSDGSYTLTEVSIGRLVLGVAGSSTSGSAVDVETADGDAGQKWTITATSGGNYKVINGLSGLALDSSGTALGSNVIQDTYTGSATQQWTFVVGP